MAGGTDWTGLLGLLGAATIGAAGSLYANYQQRKFQGAVNDLSVNLANTAHQREVADLRAAGLNPILSATGNGAPVPSLGTPRVDNVLSDFGHNAKAIGDSVSRQRDLTNDSLRLDNKLNEATLATDIQSAKAEARAVKEQAEYDAQIAADKKAQLDSWRQQYLGMADDGTAMYHINSDYLKQIRDTVEAEVKEPGTKYLQSWIGTGSNAAKDIISGAKGVRDVMKKPGKGFRRR